MGIGGTAKKLQKVAEMAEDVYARLNELREQLAEMRETAQDTRDRVDRLETENAEQRALLEALAEREGIDVETVTANAHIKEAETDESNAAADPSDEAAAGETADGGDDAQTEN
ncbi:DUF5798 family protein [Halogeometricum sp. CBA1124]|uniref:DUF5798 family protein n=1 Tax=Halogeometricum sp. CBA1124 TaxID=2668071 RepID=UPI00142B33CC|nr:DUF5798 family protein [Halogeometricum sp. CBA1124]MUV57466.1 hypothetical protein [Halogeometricum sp. CBA1124]